MRLPLARRAGGSGARGRAGRALRWVLSALAVVVAIGVVALAAMAIYVTTLPSVSDAEARVDRILQAHRGIDVGLPPPRRLGDAVVAVEDEHFYANFIVNILEGAGRAALAALHTSQDPGGSTLAQQLAKQLYGHNGTLREIGLAVKLYVTYSKAQILSMYLDAVYYGNGLWGAARAARGYFGVSAYALSWAEAAMLAGLPAAPSAYDPLRHFALAKQRQRHVLDQLVVNHYLSAAQANAAYRQRLPLRRG